MCHSVIVIIYYIESVSTSGNANHSRLADLRQTSHCTNDAHAVVFTSTRKRHLSHCWSASVLSFVWQIWSDQINAATFLATRFHGLPIGIVSYNLYSTVFRNLLKYLFSFSITICFFSPLSGRKGLVGGSILAMPVPVSVT